MSDAFRNLPTDPVSGQIRFIPPQGAPEWPHATVWGVTEWACWLKQHGWNTKQISQYLQVDRYRYGLGLRRTKTEPYTWFYKPAPRAVWMHASMLPNMLYGGARGGAKSHSARWDAYRHCHAIPEFRAIIMRRTHEELKRNHVDKCKVESARINSFYGEEVMDLNTTDHELRFPKNGSKIIFAHCQNPGDEEKYLSDEYDAFYPDEMATFEKSQIVAVAGSLRSTKPGVLARLIGTSNPGGAHTLWLKRWYIDRVVPFEENPRYNPLKYGFIPSWLYDNPYLMDPDGTYTTYEDRLYAYDEERRKQLLLGDWSALAGQFFPEFIADENRVGTHVEEFDIPRGCKIERWIDWGYDPNPGVCYWVACLPNGRLYVLYEWVFNGQGRPKMVPAEVAKKIKEYTKEVFRLAGSNRISKSVGDPSMFAKDGHTGESYEETFGKNGVHLTAADNDRVMGWGRLRHWLRGHPEDSRPWIMFHPRCVYAIRTIPGLVRDKHNPDDLDTNGEDHGADAIRYGVMGRPTPTRVVRSRPLILPGTPAALLATMRTANLRPMGSVS